MTSFFALLRELRWMIYELIPHARKHTTYVFYNSAKVIIVHVVPSTIIRCTCHYIANDWPFLLLEKAQEGL
jgi:high-affinity Fe2+/Pb2+ permease